MKYSLLDTYCLRVPMSSFTNYKKEIQKKDFSGNDIKDLLKNLLFREALFLASPELLSQIKKWEAGLLTDETKVERLKITILKYFTRISTRCTPFGLFASCSSGNFNSKTKIKLENIENYKRVTRFDITFLAQLFQVLLNNSVIKNDVLFFPNTSLYKIGKNYRYVEYIIKNKKRVYSIEGINYSIYIDKILKKAKRGCKIEQLTTAIVDDEITFEEAKYFVEELIKNQILISEIEITVTGNDYFKNLISRIKQIDGVSEIYNQLSDLQEQLTKLDEKSTNNKILYQSIINEAKKLVPKFDTKYLFQTDAFTTLKNNALNIAHKRKLNKALKVFNKISLYSGSTKLDTFKEKFIKRYDNQQLPLNYVLDIESGIGYGYKKSNNTPLLDDIPFQLSTQRHEKITWTDIDSILQKKLYQTFNENKNVLTLTEKDFEKFSEKWNDLPKSFSSIVEVYNHLGTEKIFINSAGGSSAINLLSRFGHGDDQLLKNITQLAQIEQEIEKDKILAEIVHLPEARTGNILQRPKIRGFEIPYLGKSSLYQEKQICVDDILISIENDNVILYSKKNKKEIIPKLSSAHNFDYNSLPIYQFLCDLQTQNKRQSIGFYWNSIFLELPFLPRVEFENIIFSKSRWNLETKKIREIIESKDLLLSTKRWQKDIQLPDFVELIDGDNKLLIYLKNKTAIKMLYQSVKKQKRFILEEFLFSDNGIVKKRKESFCNQFIISFYNKEKLIND